MKKCVAVTVGLTTLIMLVLSCAAPSVKPAFGVVGTRKYNDATIELERVAVPFKDGESTVVLEGMLYRNPTLTSYRGIVTTHGRNGPQPSRNPGEVSGYWTLNAGLAARGAAVLFLVRRGYGASEGKDSEFLDTPAQSGRAAAMDLATGVEYVRKLEGVKSNGIIIMGHSQGGWAAIAAASMDLEGVTATVNLCGGTNYRTMGSGRVTEQVESEWVKGCAELGATARIPSIWIYVENDPLPAPKNLKLMHEGYIGAGGRAELHILPPYKSNGHYIIEAPELFLDIVFKEILELEK